MLIAGVMFLCACSFAIGWMWRDLTDGRCQSCRLIGGGYQPYENVGPGTPPGPE